MSEIPTKIRFHYIKANGFRVIHIDGAHGGITPRGAIFAALYSERSPIPETTTHPIAEDGTLGEENKEDRKAREGIVREVEVGIMMDLGSAEAFHQWLGNHIKTLKGFQEDAKNKQDQPKTVRPS